jgi:hypothetical protein
MCLIELPFYLGLDVGHEGAATATDMSPAAPKALAAAARPTGANLV